MSEHADLEALEAEARRNLLAEGRDPTSVVFEFRVRREIARLAAERHSSRAVFLALPGEPPIAGQGRSAPAARAPRDTRPWIERTSEERERAS